MCNQNVDFNQLYSLERNETFSLSKKVYDLKSISVYYDDSVFSPANVIEKANLNSTVYSLSSKNGRLILKKVPLNLKEKLEEQCNVVAAINNCTITPLKSKTGKYTIDKYNYSWMAYWAVEGEIYNGNNITILNLCHEVADFLLTLRELGPSFTLPRWSYQPLKWKESMIQLTNPISVRNCLSGTNIHLSNFTLDAFSTYKTKILSLTDIAISNQEDLSYELTHSDLQHANIIVNHNSPVFLDIEDICADSPHVALGHSCFKIIRHCLYTKSFSKSSIVKLIPQLVDMIEAHSLWQDSSTKLFDYMVLRIISDISDIFSNWKEFHDETDLYDLEKRMHNLLEVIELFCHC